MNYSDQRRNRGYSGEYYRYRGTNRMVNPSYMIGRNDFFYPQDQDFYRSTNYHNNYGYGTGYHGYNSFGGGHHCRGGGFR